MWSNPISIRTPCVPPIQFATIPALRSHPHPEGEPCTRGTKCTRNTYVPFRYYSKQFPKENMHRCAQEWALYKTRLGLGSTAGTASTGSNVVFDTAHHTESTRSSSAISTGDTANNYCAYCRYSQYSEGGYCHYWYYSTLGFSTTADAGRILVIKTLVLRVLAVLNVLKTSSIRVRRSTRTSMEYGVYCCVIFVRSS